MKTSDEFLKWERSSRDTIDVKKIYIDVADDLDAGLMLSQIVYWHLPQHDGNSKLRVERDGYKWLVKKVDDWFEECRIKTKRAARCLKLLEERGVIYTSVYKFGGTPMTHIRIVWTKFMELLDRYANGPEPSQKEEKDEIPNGVSIIPNGKMDSVTLAESTTPDRPNGLGHFGRMDSVTLAESITESTVRDSGTEIPPKDYSLSAAADDKCSEGCEDHLFIEDSANARKRKNGCASSEEETKNCKVLAREMFVALTEKGKVDVPPDLNKWTKILLKYFQRSTTSKADFRETFQWYCENIEDEWACQAYCADSFCKKYIRIRAKMTKSQRTNNLNGHQLNSADARHAQFLRDFDNEG